MKKMFFAIAVMLVAVCLASCGSEGKKEEETTEKTDWRNTIEYESSFFVNEGKKMLYALDKGSITIWDNAGEGKALQVIEYDTSVSDAIERIEKEDFNNDGNRDIRIIYSENEKGTRYNLFLWSEKAGRFVKCLLYNTITNPVFEAESGYVAGVTDRGVFGKVIKYYTFNENSGLSLVTSDIGDIEDIAKTVGAAVGGDSVEKIVNAVTVDRTPCGGYYVNANGKRIAYIAYNTDSQWYVDEGCCGLYRQLDEVEGAIVAGDYVGDAKHAYSLAKLKGGEGAKLIDTSYGVLAGSEAQRFDVRGENGKTFSLVTDTKNLWYYSEDGATFVQVISLTGEVAGEEEFEFAVPEA